MKKTYFIIYVLSLVFLFSACERESFSDNENGDEEDNIENETSGIIRDTDDAEIIAKAINNILEDIRDNVMDYGNSYTNYSPEDVNGGYSITGNAVYKPIFTGSYTYEYIKNFDVTFNNHTLNNGTVFKEGSISYSFHDYSTSGYHLIISGNSTSAIHITCDNDGYLISDIITNLSLGDKNDNKYNISMSFKSSSGSTHAFDGL